MGTPKARKKHFSNAQVLEPVSVAQKMRVFALAKQTRAILTSESLEGILETTKEILLPMAWWLDKPFPEHYAFSEEGISAAHLEKKRVMLVYNGYGHGRFLSLVLERSGMWYVQPFNNEKKVFPVSSRELADIVILRIGELVKCNMTEDEAGRNGVDGVLQEAIEKLFRYEALLRFIAECHETIEKTIESQEERTRIMRERLDLLDDCAQAFDPLLARGSALELLYYGFEGDGGRPSTESYFTPEAIEPFREAFEGWATDFRESQRKYERRFPFNSLGRVAWYFGNLIDGIRRGRETVRQCPGRQPAAALVGAVRGRLPLTPEEASKLRELLDAIASIA